MRDAPRRGGISEDPRDGRAQQVQKQTVVPQSRPVTPGGENLSEGRKLENGARSLSHRPGTGDRAWTCPRGRVALGDPESGLVCEKSPGGCGWRGFSAHILPPQPEPTIHPAAPKSQSS